MLHELFEEGRLPTVPIYIDSPLAVNASDVFRLHPECFDEETMKLLHAHEDPFGFGRLQYIRTVEESKKLNDLKSSCIIISASGMCEGGRVVHHLANTIEDPKNTILFVGYQAEHTLGRRLVEKQQEVTIFGDVYKVNAEIAILNSFSAHAGQDEIVGYIEQVDKAKLKEIFLVHGEIEQAEKLKAKLAEHHYENIVIPQRGDKVELL